MIKHNRTAWALALFCLLTAHSLQAQAPDPSVGYWQMDILAAQEPTVPGVVTYTMDAGRIRASQAQSLSSGIAYGFGGDRTTEGASGYANCYMTQKLPTGPVDHVVVRLNPFTATEKVCLDPRFDARTNPAPSKVIKFYVKVPSGWHYVVNSATATGPVPVPTYAQETAVPPVVVPVTPFAAPPLYAKLVGDALSPNMLTLTFTCDSTFPQPAYGVYDDPVYSATFQLAPDVSSKLSRNSANSVTSLPTRLGTAYLQQQQFKATRPHETKKGTP